jgi:hypothetical protein
MLCVTIYIKLGRFREKFVVINLKGRYNEEDVGLKLFIDLNCV